MLRFDRVVPTLIHHTILHLPLDPRELRAVLVQTATGQVRLALVGKTEEEYIEVLQRALKVALGTWFQPPVIGTECGPRALRPIARQLWRDLQPTMRSTTWQQRWPRSWTKACVDQGIEEAQLRDSWECTQVFRSKEPWLLSRPAETPWQMRGDNPPITAFYGFKGGVGRSTTLAILAWHLALKGKRVLCVDLDLESPGLAQALSHDGPNVDILNWLLQAALDPKKADQLDRPWVQLELHDRPLWLAGPGRLDGFYTDKLGRLDFLHQENEQSPVHQALTNLLHIARRELQLDHILLDCRSGLHDLAGLALHDLAHVAVLVGRGDRQELAGLSHFWRSLWRRQGPEGHLLVLRTGHSLPLNPELLDLQRKDLHALLVQHWEDPNRPPPALEELGQPHDPCPIGDIQEIRNADGLARVAQITLGHDLFVRALHRLEALWNPV
jgi:cellulose biosynthesis protein BcsQ